MDIYSILEKLAVISNKQTLTEGRVKHDLEDLARQVSKEKFVADAGEYGMGKEEAAEFWVNSNGGEEEVDEAHEKLPVDQLGLDKFSQAALSGGPRKRDALRNPNQTRMLAKKSAQQQPVREADEAFAKGDRVMYNNTFATVVGQDGDAYIVKVDKQPNTMKVPASAIKKPSYDEGVSENKKAKKDYDGDGKIETGKDEYMGSRMKAAGKNDGKNDAKGAFQKQMGGSAGDLTKGLSIGAKKVSENKHDLPFDVDPKEKATKKVTPGKHGQEYSQVRHLARKGMSSDAKKSSKQDKISESDMEEQGQVAEKKLGALRPKLGTQRDIGKSVRTWRKERGLGESSDEQSMLESDMDEGNKFAHNVLKAKAAGIKKADLDGDGDMEPVREMFPGTPEYELRFGKDDAASAFDKKKISTGTVYTRKHQEEPETDDDTPRAAGRPKGSKRRLGAKGPGVDSKLLKGKGGLKEGDIDIVDRGEYDREGDMALSQVHQIADAARELHAILASDDNLPEWVQSKITKALDYIDTARDYLDAEKEMDREELPEIAPIVGALAGRALAGAAGAGSTGQAIGSLAGRAVAGAMNSNDEVEEAGYSAKAARAGKDIGKPGKNFGKIAKGAAERYGSKAAGERVAGAVLNKLRAKEGVEEGGKDRAAGKKSGVPSSISTAELKAELKRRTKTDSESTDTRDQRAEKAGKRVTKDIEYDEGHKGRDDAKAEKAGKKVAKDIEYDDKKDKEKKVDETTVSGSVATGGDAPKKSKGGMQFGQGVYENAIAESFNKKLGGILTEGMSVNVSTDDTGKKSITVNATDADADSLGNMLKMAGLFSSEGYSRTCEHCHGIHEAGACQAEQVAEDFSNSPDEVYADKDYMTQTLSGGLNGPKTTGQTTGPIVNQQPGRQGVMAEAERVVEQSETRLWNLYKQYDKK
jgi:hypothetical protein